MRNQNKKPFGCPKCDCQEVEIKTILTSQILFDDNGQQIQHFNKPVPLLDLERDAKCTDCGYSYKKDEWKAQ